MDPTAVTAWAAGVTAAAAVASAIVALLLWRVTSKYTAETEAIAKASDRMADANERVLEEMRADRLHFHHERSVDAAERLTAALTAAVRDWTAARDDSAFAHYGGLRTGTDRPEGYTAEEKRTRAFQDWLVAYFNDRGPIEPARLRKDLERFTLILRAATYDWDTILALIENEQGERRAQQRRDNDNRTYRLELVATRLRNTLEAHRRGEPIDRTVLPKRYWDFWKLPPGIDHEELEAFMENQDDA